VNAPHTCRLAAAVLLAAFAAMPARPASAAPRVSAAPDWTTALDWLEQKIPAPEPVGIEAFGSAVAVQGDTAFVSAPKHPQGPSGGQGIVYVYHYADGAWSLVQSLTADDAAPGDEFGNAIALQGSTAMIATHFAAIGGLPQAGAVYVFHYDGTQWLQAQKLVADTPVLVANFGDSVALDGTTAVIGASNEHGAAQEPSVGARDAELREAVLGQLDDVFVADDATADLRPQPRYGRAHLTQGAGGAERAQSRRLCDAPDLRRGG